VNFTPEYYRLIDNLQLLVDLPFLLTLLPAFSELSLAPH